MVELQGFGSTWWGHNEDKQPGEQAGKWGREDTIRRFELSVIAWVQPDVGLAEAGSWEN